MQISNRLVISSGNGIRFTGNLEVIDESEIENCLFSLFTDGGFIYATGTIKDPKLKAKLFISANKFVNVNSLKAEVGFYYSCSKYVGFCIRFIYAG
jgi:hypothetical protein